MITPPWRRLLKPLVPVYSGAIKAKENLLQRGLPQVRRLSHPVISVGSISAGGAGKTPVVVMLAQQLSARGFEVRILTRGYGRSGNATERVDPNGDAKRFGDEPLMMARMLPGVSVWVGADRYRSARLAEAHDQPGAKVVYLLDDGFQHRRLARDVDVVLVTRQDLEDSLLPLGNLREPLRAMCRADVVVLRQDEGFAGDISGCAATWFIQRKLSFPKRSDLLPQRSDLFPQRSDLLPERSDLLPEPSALPKRAVAFCALARPEGFFAMLSEAGVEVAAVSSFRDHHVYSDRDIQGLLELAAQHAADGFVTTAKDAVKLTAAMRQRLRVVVVPELQVELRDPDANIGKLLDLLASAERSRPA